MYELRRQGLLSQRDNLALYFEEMLDCIPDMVVRLDQDYTIEWANVSVMKMDAEAIGKKCFEVFQSSEFGCLQCPCVRAIRENGIVEDLVQNEQPGKEGEYWHKCAVPVVHENGQAAGVVVIVKEAPESKASMRQYEILADELEKEQKKSQIREDKNRSLFYEMVESLRGIFENINNDMDRLRVIELYRDERDTIERLMNQSDKAYRKISNLHEIYSIEEGQLVFNVSSFSVSDFVDDLYHRFRFLSKKRDVDFTIQVDDNLPRQWIGDPVRLGNIVRNLVENAFEHTDHGSVQVQIAKVSVIDDRLKLRITVRDTGIGFSEEKLEWLKRLTENPEPADILESLGDSTGLGYVTALTILSKMGGKLEIESSYGRGSEINVFLYVDYFERDSVETAETAFEHPQPDPPIETRKRKRILIAEDDVMGRVSLKLLLQEAYDLDYARTGKEAVERYFRQKPDLVLMDIMMPQMNGFEAYDEIERADHFRCPIVAISAMVIDSERDYLTGYGFDEHLPKPVDEGLLRKTLDKFFK